MRTTLRRCGAFAAACLLAAAVPAFAKPGHDDDSGPPATKPGNGNGHGGGDHPGPPDPPAGNPDATKIKVRGPSGSCSANAADGIDLQGPDGQSGASHVAHTDFGLVDPTTGDPVAGATATMMYFWYGSTFDYVLNAHGLAAGSQWTLTYQPEPAPSAGVVCLGGATANGGGQLHLASSIELNSNLPPGLDPTGDPATQPPDALLALVPSADVDCAAGANTVFEPALSLWSNPRVRYVDTDLLPQP
jgi:hypothetical protein